MDKLRMIVDGVYDELRDAKHYARLALSHKESNQRRASQFDAMSKEELGHARILHEMFRENLDRCVSAGTINQHQRDALYHWEHDTVMKKEAELSSMYDLFRK